MKTYKTTHMVKLEDLNHHRNLYAGRAIEWMVEASFISASLEYGDGHGLLYKNTHQFSFEKSVEPGEIISFCGTVVRAGKKSLTVRVGLISEKTGELKAEGYTTFVSVKPHTNESVEHGLLLDETEDLNELTWREKANFFFE
ncbi:acyl-CoA thioesterase [Clostridium aminobutyricum]|uniref:Acyl-CoA thioesterase n=1 Tax=Clostridium aminobutyricum TaxID=33953 RepID=A0A939D6R5_CLOAM|nr:hotdog domain-containing protein [Clostridium aminobutyricum]MBN7772132.1 acyl-CoA thioesterase [Clostridium aminobutyricum]